MIRLTTAVPGVILLPLAALAVFALAAPAEASMALCYLDDKAYSPGACIEDRGVCAPQYPYDLCTADGTWESCLATCGAGGGGY